MILLNGKPINVTLFPDNTSQVWKLDPFPLQTATIEWKFQYESEIMQLAQLKALLDFSGVYTAYLDIKYLPYGRQDKAINNHSTFALKPFAWFLNTLNFSHVNIQDPHSIAATVSINNAKAYYPTGAANAAYIACGSDTVMYPDKGAGDKYRDIYIFEDVVIGDKVRDPLTGHISKYEIPDVCQGKKVLIVDDICDGGATFLMIAQELYRQKAAQVDLFVTHGIFSKGVRALFREGIRRIFTADGEIFAKDFQ
jgi:ribose-phosphate pyrophosphokinase